MQAKLAQSRGKPNFVRRLYDGSSSLILRLFHIFENAFNQLVGEKNNFFYFLGAIPILLLVILFITGLYLFIYYSMAVDTTYSSIQYMTERAVGGRFMRSLHRYAADAMIFFAVMHLIRVFVESRYQNHRRFAWLTGVLILFFLVIQGVIGYVMPLDSLARFVLEKTSEILSSLYIFGDTLPRSFSTPSLMGKWIMWVILIVHLAIPLLFVFMIFLHLKRASRARIFPPGEFSAVFTILLAIFALLFPVKMLAVADASYLPYMEQTDWFYLFFGPFLSDDNNLKIFFFFAGVMLFLTAVPWYKKKPEINIAKVSLDHCTGCTLCSRDCPYEAIRMQPRSDGKSYKLEAFIYDELCSGCGICVGSCDFDGMAWKETPLVELESRIKSALEGSEDNWLGLVCEKNLKNLKQDGRGALQDAPNIRILQGVKCVGLLGPEMADRARKLGARGIVIGSCAQGDCHYREGNQHVAERVFSIRKPFFKRLSEFPVKIIRFNSAGARFFPAQALALIKESDSTQKLLKAGVRLLHPVLALAAIALFVWIFYLGSAANMGTIPLDKSQSLVRIDFFRLTGQVSCDLSKIPKEEFEKAYQAKIAFFKFDNMAEEAEGRIKATIREGLKDKFCDRYRRALRLIVEQGERRITHDFKPTGIQNDGLTYVLHKFYTPPGKQEITVRAVEMDNGEEQDAVEYKFDQEFEGGRVYFLDFDKNSHKFFLRNLTMGSINRVE